MPHATPPDLQPEERAVHASLALLAPAVPPDALRARILAAAEPGVGSPLSAGLVAIAATVMIALGTGLFAHAASDARAAGRPSLAVVDDPAMPLLEGVEPAGSLGPYDEVIFHAGR